MTAPDRSRSPSISDAIRLEKIREHVKKTVRKLAEQSDKPTQAGRKN